MLAVKVDYETKQATIGTAADKPLDRSGILAALEEVRYRGAFQE